MSLEVLSFINGLVSEAFLRVAPEWLGTDDVSLSIDITGINSGFRLHGSQEVLVSEAVFVAEDGNASIISVAWTADMNLTHSPETYTVCAHAKILATL